MDWGRAGVQLLAREVDLVIVVDLLSFSTAVSIAVERGAAVIPYRVSDASAAAYARGIGATLAGAHRSGPGPTLSPASLTALRGGERLVLPSRTGRVALRWRQKPEHRSSPAVCETPAPLRGSPPRGAGRRRSSRPGSSGRTGDSGRPSRT
jgi:2-phosphosulfolactate phosphatase